MWVPAVGAGQRRYPGGMSQSAAGRAGSMPAVVWEEEEVSSLLSQACVPRSPAFS